MTEAVSTPKFSVEIGTVLKKGTESGNAILVNKEKGIFATCAHVLHRRWNEYKLLLHHGERMGGVKVVERWHHWDADIALVRIDQEKLWALRDYSDATMIDSLPQNLSFPKLNVTGFVNTEPFSHTVSYMRFPTNFAITGPNYFERDEVRHMWHVPKSKRSILYENYMYLLVDGVALGASGSAVVNSDGHLMGMISHASDSQALAIPASEIMKFARRFL